MTIEIRKYTIGELDKAPNVLELFKEYEAESAIVGLPPISAKLDLYLYLEKNGSLTIFGAFLRDVLIGFVTVLAPVIPHYGIVVATTESIFVAKKYRMTGAGLKLLKAAEDHAITVGSPGLLLSAPKDGALMSLLPRLGYTETSRIYFRKLNGISETAGATSNGTASYREGDTISDSITGISANYH